MQSEESNTLVKLAKAVIEHAPEGGDAFWDIKFSDIEAALSAAEPQPDFWDIEEAREKKLATVVVPDNGTTAEVLSAVLECAEAWVPEARIIGNVRAGDIARAVRSALSAQVQDVAGDGRPCSMDEFVSALFSDGADHFDVKDAINEWLRGDWGAALSYLNDDTRSRLIPAAPAKQEGGKSNPVHKQSVDSGESGDE